jgi:heparanase 1
MKSDGSAVGAWNYSNAESFISYTVKKNFSIYGWELGKNTLQCFLVVDAND